MTLEEGGSVTCQAAWNSTQEERGTLPPRALAWHDRLEAVEVGQESGREGAWGGGVVKIFSTV